ncbi:MAG: PIN domain-containing protein [Smithella sp.]
MKKIFREYHQFTDQEFQQLWKNCFFVFDTNTLLNMYRYSRTTVDAYFDVLNELKKNKQLWIPYQVGYEFYENRINVISEYEKSYDEILSILEKAKSDIEAKYKDHPFLNLYEIKEEMGKGLSGVEKKIKQAQKNHPKWLEKDEVLEKLNSLFDGNIGNNYDEQKLIDIKKEGKERYEKRIPPGFKDDKKTEDKKYGDLILWYQIIDKAKESKKPIILISGDVKDDWWLEKDGKRLMPLPQLKKEIFDKAGVDFHIYTADRFLELNKTGKKEIDENTIKEVRKVRELEEKRMMIRRMEMMERERELDPIMFKRYSVEYTHLFDILEGVMAGINRSEINSRYRDELDYMSREIRKLRNRIVHGEINSTSFDMFYKYTKEISFVLHKIIHSEEINPDLSIKLKEYIDRLEYLNQRLRRNI